MPAPDLTPLDLAPPPYPLRVFLHADHARPEDLAGSVALVIDNLRASVTITAALAHGARAVIPTLTVDEALARRERHLREHPTDPPLLGGERGGILIPGFDLDNSPRAYTRDRVDGRTIIFTTANGTAALLRAKGASLVLIASLVNLSAVAQAVADDPRPVRIIACGTRDAVGLDDALPAGALAERLTALGRTPDHDDAARLARLAWDAGRPSLLDQMRDSRGGRGLARLGLTDDLAFCSAIDSLPVVPRFDPASGAITLLPAPPGTTP
ncbi:MAG: 2-phosphosulfolactate phosphatase [Phycisphaeraceae bacterium]|nr:MAG: 2-phosphosulfolactate phosphatase [Phycisphaeraceae bacterium]